MNLIPGEYDVLLNGVNIHYTIRGKGPVLIAHSGGPGADARDWDDFAKIDDFVTIVAIHPRGSGLSGPATGDAYLLPDYASDTQALRVHLGLEKPILMGWSHGGMISLQMSAWLKRCTRTFQMLEWKYSKNQVIMDLWKSPKNFIEL